MKNNKATAAVSNKAAAKAAAKAAKKAAAQQAGATAATQESATVAAVTTAAQKVIAERLEGKTLEGNLSVTIKRHDLSKGESKCAMIKRLLMTEGMDKATLIAQVEKAHGALKDSTLNTVRADLKRTIGANVLCTGWRTDDKKGKLATAAVAKLRTHELGTAYASAALVYAAAKKAETAAATAAASEEQSEQGEEQESAE